MSLQNISYSSERILSVSFCICFASHFSNIPFKDAGKPLTNEQNGKREKEFILLCAKKMCLGMGLQKDGLY